MPISKGPWTLRGPKFSIASECGHRDCSEHKRECTGFDLIDNGGVWITSILGEHTNVPLAEITPNAQLIAAAPDLLEACRAALAAHCDYRNNTPTEVSILLSAAIAKAEGAQ